MCTSINIFSEKHRTQTKDELDIDNGYSALSNGNEVVYLISLWSHKLKISPVVVATPETI